MNTAVLRQIAQTYSTPAYVFDLPELESRVSAIRNILPASVGLCYSIKANPFLVSSMDKSIGLLEVCSPGELEICIHNSIDPSHILLSGVSKTAPDIERAIEYGVRLFTCESLLHVTLLEAAAARHGLTLPVLLRLTAASQFGMDLSDLEHVIASRAQLPHLQIEGIHYFSGTQRKKLQDQRKELLYLSDICTHLREAFGFTVRKIEYGTGLYYPYFINEDRSDTLAPVRELAPDLAHLAEQVQLTIEMGRFFASSCGTFLTTVQDTKINKGQAYAILDGGIHHLNYYGGSMGMRIPEITRIPAKEPDAQGTEASWMLCGSLCTTADILVRSYNTKNLEIGDILAFHDCGAYSVTEAPALFLSREMPAILLLSASGFTQARPPLDSWKMNTLQEPVKK